MRVFVSSSDFKGNFETIAQQNTDARAGDTLCQMLADSAYLGGTWTAHISSADAGALERFTADGPWVLVGAAGGAVFANRAAMSGPPLQPINRDQFGSAHTGSVWSGTAPDGGIRTDTCNGWSSENTATYGWVGLIGTSPRWLSDAIAQCSIRNGLYCFEQSHLRPDGGTGYPPTPAAKRVFVSSTQFTGNLPRDAGVAPTEAADLICGSLASDAGLGGSWKAWLSTDTVAAIDRLTFTGPWRLVGGDAGVVFANREELAVAAAKQVINRTQTGGLVSSGRDVWTGTGQGGVPASTCNNWSTASGSFFGTRGSTSVPRLWSSEVAQSCNSTASLYCFEQ